MSCGLTNPRLDGEFGCPNTFRSTSYWRLPAPGSDGWFEIIGVVGDTPNVGLHQRPAPSIYVPYTLMLSDTQYLILRTSRDPLSMTRSIREAVQYRRSQSTSERNTHSGKRAGGRGLGS